MHQKYIIIHLRDHQHQYQHQQQQRATSAKICSCTSDIYEHHLWLPSWNTHVLHTRTWAMVFYHLVCIFRCCITYPKKVFKPKDNNLKKYLKIFCLSINVWEVKRNYADFYHLWASECLLGWWWCFCIQNTLVILILLSINLQINIQILAWVCCFALMEAQVSDTLDKASSSLTLQRHHECCTSSSLMVW